MYKKIIFAFAAAVLLFTWSGCISYSYSGEKAAPAAEKAELFYDSGKINKKYNVLGTAVVSGDYMQISRDRMLEKLKYEARKCGADAILIIEHQVLPADMAAAGRKSGFFTAFDYDDTNRSWGELYRDVDVNFGNIGKSSASGGSSGISGSKRIIRAEFLRYTNGESAPAKK